MGKFALRLTVCSAVLLAAAAGAGFAAPAHAGGTSVPGSSGDSGGAPGGPQAGGETLTAPDDLGGMPATVETLSTDPPQTSSGSSTQLNQNNARNAVERGYVRPLGWLLTRLKKTVPGDVVKVRLRHQKTDIWTYDVTILNESGRYVQVSLNAATGVIISKRYR